MKRLHLLVLGICLLFLLLSCTSNKSQTLNDIVSIKDELPVSIIVTFNDEYEGFFEITEEELISQVIDMLNAREYIFTKDAPAPGSNRTLTLKYESGEEVKVSTRIISVSDGYYIPDSQDNLDYFLEKKGIESGTVEPR